MEIELTIFFILFSSLIPAMSLSQKCNVKLQRKAQSGLISAVSIKPLAPDSSRPREGNIIIKMA